MHFSWESSDWVGDVDIYDQIVVDNWNATMRQYASRKMAAYAIKNDLNQQSDY
jgi:hypothetical protein